MEKPHLAEVNLFMNIFDVKKNFFLMIEVVLVSEIQLFESKLPYIEYNHDTP